MQMPLAHGLQHTHSPLLPTIRHLRDPWQARKPLLHKEVHRASRHKVFAKSSSKASQKKRPSGRAQKKSEAPPQLDEDEATQDSEDEEALEFEDEEALEFEDEEALEFEDEEALETEDEGVLEAEDEAGLGMEDEEALETDDEAAIETDDEAPFEERFPYEAANPGVSLYEPVHGLPIVHKKISYAEVLKAIRTDQVYAVQFFSFYTIPHKMDGRCLVLFWDGSVAQSLVPLDDVRLRFAMQSHSVDLLFLDSGPDPDQIFKRDPFPAFKTPNWSATVERAKETAAIWIPFFLLGLVWAATQYADSLKGDKDDRDKIRDMEIEHEKADRAQAKKDQAAQAPQRLAQMGYSVDAIIQDLNRRGKRNVNRDFIVKLVEKQQRREDALRGNKPQTAEEAEKLRKFRKDQLGIDENVQANDMEQNQDFLTAGNVKLKRALDPESEEIRLANMRSISRQMKGFKLQYLKDETVFFDDVAGISAAKYELEEVVDFFIKPARFTKSGARVPRGVLMGGPPGTGKTLLARAVAGEAGVNFLSMNASEFVEMFVGVGASRVRDLFRRARAVAPAIVFIDELDAIGRVRGGAQGNDERDQTLNQLLSEMDGFNTTEGVIVMGATNRTDILDPALVRPGRFDRIIHIGNPDFEGRVETFQVHLNKRGDAVADDVTEESIREVAYNLDGASGAMIANIVNLAGLRAEKAGRDQIRIQDIADAIVAGSTGAELAPYSSPRQKRLAVHQMSTALACCLLPAIEPVDFVDLTPTQDAPLGRVATSLNSQRVFTQQWTRQYLEEQLLTTLAGRAAEELLYTQDEMSTINQRQMVVARMIVQKLTVAAAMTDNPSIGPRTISTPVKLGGGREGGIVSASRITHDTRLVVDEQLQSMLDQAYFEVKALLERNMGALETLIDQILVAPGQRMEGNAIRSIIEEKGHPTDLKHRTENKAAFL